MNTCNELPADERPLTSKLGSRGPDASTANRSVQSALAAADDGEARAALLPETQPQPELDYRSVMVGRLLGLVDQGRRPLVLLPAPQDIAGRSARSLVDLHHDHVGCEVLLTFEQADPMRPIVMGVLRGSPASEAPAPALEVRMDGGRVLLEARQSLVLRCGKSHLTLHEDGRVELHGETVVTRAAGANKVQGGSVQLN